MIPGRANKDEQIETLRARLAAAEDELQAMLHSAGASRRNHEPDSRTNDEFLAVLAHELRNPLCAICNAVRVIEVTHARGKRAAIAHEVIARQISHISRLLEDLLDVDRIVSGKMRLHRQPLDMAEAVRRALDTFTGDARRDRHIDISTEPVWVDGDAMRIEQVVANLVTNAVKYTPSRGRISVSLRADGGDAVLTVEDTGAGIPPELMPFIFDLYVQNERTLDRAQGGVGIGLTLVRRLVELHGGTVVAWSEGEGRGSRFTVRLKQVPPAQVPSSVVAPDHRARLISDGAGVRSAGPQAVQGISP